jgi:putative chitinase
MSDLIRQLQRRVGVTADGAYGPATHRAVMAALDRAAPAPSAAARRLRDPALFFAAVRPLTGALTQPQVDAITALLARAGHWQMSWVAYGLATAWHETGGKLQPNIESLNYSVDGLLRTFGRHRISEADARALGRKPGEGPLPIERQRAIANRIYGGAWGVQNLGNTGLEDGWRFRGRGMDHCTGRRNYERTGRAIGVNLIAMPDELLQLPNAVAALVTGMQAGRYTGHTLAQHLPSPFASVAQFTEARRIINGTDCAADIAAIARTFQAGLEQGEWG